MTYETINNYPIVDAPENFMCYVNDITGGIFMGLLFIAIWSIITFGSFFMTKKATGSGDLPVSMSLGSFTTLVFSVLMRLVTCQFLKLTSDLALGTIIGVTFLSVIFLFFSRD